MNRTDHLHIRITPALNEQIKAYATEHEISVTQAVVIAVKALMNSGSPWAAPKR